MQGDGPSLCGAVSEWRTVLGHAQRVWSVGHSLTHRLAADVAASLLRFQEGRTIAEPNNERWPGVSGVGCRVSVVGCR